jgi:hypothetical protein
VDRIFAIAREVDFLMQKSMFWERFGRGKRWFSR